MELTYEELVKYDIWRAIELKGKDRREFKTTQELLHANDNDPAKIPNNPLLTDYNWVYKNAEKLLYNNIFDYQQFQGIEEYYTLFKAITNKYSLENDYEEYINGNFPCINMKWGMFAIKLIKFISYTLDERLKTILNKEDVMNYFLKYPAIYDHEKIEYFYQTGIESFLTYPYYSDYYINDYRELIQLIRNKIKIEIPTELMLNDKIIKDISRTYRIENFYFYLYFISEQIAPQPYLDEHKKFCDEEIEKIENGILPCYQQSYKQLPNEITLEDIKQKHNSMETQVIERIFIRNGLTTLPNEYVYQELSKYLIIGMFISRNYETDPFNILIDINTLYNHAKENNRNLQGMEIYEFIHDYESKTIKEIIDFYNNTKNLPLKEMLYDDWENEKESFVTELNSQMININKLSPQTTDSKITYYDISDVEEPILVHNTSVPITNKEKIKEMIDRIKNGKIYTLSLSVQDQNHTIFHEKDENKYKNRKTIKLAYGHLTSNRVGLIHHTDAYSTDPTTTEAENFNFKREMHTVKSLMDNTTDYNELTYVVYKTPFLPIGIICEDEITIEEQDVASELNIPILFRNKKDRKEIPYQERPYQKGYQYTKEKCLF